MKTYQYVAAAICSCSIIGLVLYHMLFLSKRQSLITVTAPSSEESMEYCSLFTDEEKEAINVLDEVLESYLTTHETKHLTFTDGARFQNLGSRELYFKSCHIISSLAAYFLHKADFDCKPVARWCQVASSAGGIAKIAHCVLEITTDGETYYLDFKQLLGYREVDSETVEILHRELDDPDSTPIPLFPRESNSAVFEAARMFRTYKALKHKKYKDALYLTYATEFADSERNDLRNKNKEQRNMLKVFAAEFNRDDFSKVFADIWKNEIKEITHILRKKTAWMDRMNSISKRRRMSCI